MLLSLSLQREYGGKKADLEEHEKYRVNFEVLDIVTHGIRDAEPSVIAYYNLRGDRPVVIYFTIEESRGKNWIYASMYPTSYKRRTNEGHDLQQVCLKKYIKPLSEVALENATQAIASARQSGLDVEGAEELLKYARGNFENGDYEISQSNALDVIALVDSAKKLSEYRSLSDDEKRKQVIGGLSHLSKEKTNMSEGISDEYIIDNLGSNQQFNVFLDDESNSLYYKTKIIDFNNRTQTFYENQAVGEYDFYIGFEAKQYYETMFMVDARVPEFSYGKRFGMGIVKGEIKIKPFWKFYKVLSTDFARGMSAGMT